MATTATMATMATTATCVSMARRVSRRGSSGHRLCTRARGGEDDGHVDVAAPVSGRRALLLAAGAAAALAPRASPAADIGSVSLSSAAVNEPLKPLAEYTAALDRAASELAEIAKTLADLAGADATSRVPENSSDDPNYFDDPELSALYAPLSAKARDTLKARLHSGELGRFWATSRGADRYLAGARSSFARDREDLWKLLPEKSGPLGRLLRPDFDNPDDPLCLIYSCVNDPRAPPSIDVLYALKLLDEGLATDGVTAPGLTGNCQDAADKLAAYQTLVAAEADASLEDAEWRNPAPAKGWGRVGI